MSQPSASDDLKVDAASIEKSLADLWRSEKQDGQKAITRAALWNVVAHTWTAEDHSHATDTLGRASASVPQRTIVIRAEPKGRDDIASWISANCHLLGGNRQVCSEEIAITASGESVEHIPPLVSALLLPDMPVAVWWLGDLPSAHHQYVETLLEPADRLIVDSTHFDSAADLELISRIAEDTTTAPADLSWVRLEEWRTATAAMFDSFRMRQRLPSLRSIRVVSGGENRFGERAEGLLFVSWLHAQLGMEIAFELIGGAPKRGIEEIELTFDGASATVRRDRERGVIVATADGEERAVDCIARVLERKTADLIVRQLKKPESDRVYLKALRVARRLAPSL
ncbi:MAG TPA: glucose-6-phosphate dehydrogenase assembly protein OpcA [Thermoanaerobaculia bacterium]|jgi:glucose-6-phosphate dehydrogenase assembly protein OpcA